jgi:hypothetical protein
LLDDLPSLVVNDGWLEQQIEEYNDDEADESL